MPEQDGGNIPSILINKSTMKNYLFLLTAFLISSYSSAQTWDTIRFETITNLIKIPVLVNGTIHYFMFDTGAEMSVIREDLTAGLDKSKSCRKRVKDANNKMTSQPVFVIQSLKFGKSDVRNLKVITFPDSPLFHCLGVEGFIGVDIIRQFDWFIDFDKHYIVKTDPAGNIDGFTDYVAMDFYKNKLRPRIRLKTGSKVVDYLFDSGANSSQIEENSYRKIKNDVVKSYDEITSVSGATSFDLQSKEAIVLITTHPDDPGLLNYPVLLNTISVGENKIGNEFWGKNQVFFSWAKSKLLFRMGNTEKEKSFGITFKVANDSMVVNTLIYTEQIRKSGVKTGDKVKSINGESYKDNCKLRTYQLLNKEETLTFELLNGKQFTLRRERLD
jgi:hypothetical protein